MVRGDCWYISGIGFDMKELQGHDLVKDWYDFGQTISAEKRGVTLFLLLGKHLNGHLYGASSFT